MNVETPRQFDAVELELLWRRLISLVDEAAAALEGCRVERRPPAGPCPCERGLWTGLVQTVSWAGQVAGGPGRPPAGPACPVGSEAACGNDGAVVEGGPDAEEAGSQSAHAGWPWCCWPAGC